MPGDLNPELAYMNRMGRRTVDLLVAVAEAMNDPDTPAPVSARLRRAYDACMTAGRADLEAYFADVSAELAAKREATADPLPQPIAAE